MWCYPTVLAWIEIAVPRYATKPVVPTGLWIECVTIRLYFSDSFLVFLPKAEDGDNSFDVIATDSCPSPDGGGTARWEYHHRY